MSKPAPVSGEDDAAARRAAAELFFEHSQDLFGLFSDTGDTLMLNPAWEALTGWSMRELRAKRFAEFTHPDDMDQLMGAVAQALSEGQANTKVRIRTRGGDWRWLAGKSSRAPDGRIVSVMRDVTEDEARLRDLEDARRTNSLVSESAGVGAWCYEPDGERVQWSDDILAITGYAHEEMSTAEQFAAICHPRERETVQAAFGAGVLTGSHDSFEHSMLTKDGRWTKWRATFHTEPRPGGVFALKGISQDITELAAARDRAQRGEAQLRRAARKLKAALDAAQAASEAKANFLANMSHEIRTPMNGVLGVLHLLRREALSQGGLKLLEEAVACGHMLSELLNDVLDFSKIEAGRLELTPEPVQPDEIVAGVARLLAPQAEAKGLTLRVDGGLGEAWRLADPVRLRQTLFNLVGNAVKFTHHGHVTVRSRAVARSRLRFEIEDTGVGIPHEAQAGLFQRFTQADASTTRRYGGSGLGLSITKRLAELMGGDVGFSSVPGKGSTFWIEIAAPVAQAPRREHDTDAAWLTGLCILVVEDNATNRLIATKLLENLGASVETAASGEAGVAAAARGAFDLILMDIQMPDIDGLEATRRIRALPGRASGTPIVALTANVLAHQRAQYLGAGMNGVVGKPIVPAALLAEIARIAGEAETADPAAA